MNGLLLVSFGTSRAETREKTIDVIESRIRAEFPEFAFYTAWTSGRIVKKVRTERGEHHDTLEEAFARLTADGVDDLIVVTTCLMQGGEMAKITKAVNDWIAGGKRAAVTTVPILWSVYDRRAVARVIRDEFADVPTEDVVLLMGHGTKGGPVYGANLVYGDVEAELLALGCDNVFVATVEGRPDFEEVWPHIKSRNPKCVHLAPLMLVAGDHAINDMSGEDEDSWESKLNARGMRTEVRLKGLGEYEGIRELICEHAHDALMMREVALRG